MKVVVVGGGLSGLVAAGRVLAATEPVNVHLLEAQPRVGGRVLSTPDGLDLGGSWVWVDNFPATVKLVQEVGVALMKHPGARGSEHRVVGGMGALADALLKKAKDAAREKNADFQLSLDSRTTKIQMAGDRVQVLVEQDRGGNTVESTVSADVLLLALPCRLVATSLVWEPELPPRVVQRLKQQSTWMGGMGKAAFVYSTPWWRDLRRGNNIHDMRPATRGPVVQFMDGSTEGDRVLALVAFLAPTIHPSGGRNDTAEVLASAERQLEETSKAVTGKVHKAERVEIKLWHQDEFCFSHLPEAVNNQGLYYGHPEPWDAAITTEVANLFSGRVILCGSETDTNQPGYIEGAVRAGTVGARMTLERLRHQAESK